MKRYIKFILIVVLILLLSACGIKNDEKNKEKTTIQTESEYLENAATTSELTENTESQNAEQIEAEAETATETVAQTTVNVPSRPSVQNKQVDEITAEDIPLPSDFDPNGTVIVIDAGHQGRGNSHKEPDGPGSSTRKAKVSSGTTGCVTGVPEYQLTLEVSLKLRDELKARGYQVVMIRETNSINISNSERAKVANNLNADAFIRIHADAVDNSSVKGATALCQTSSNPYNAQYYSASRKLSDCILTEFVESTGAKKRSIQETDTMSGINWCQVPVTILEMGFMSNPEEDRLLNSEEYQAKIVQGIANGIDAYFGR